MVLSGVERHATVIANALRGDALQHLDITALLDLGAMAVLGFVIGWLGSVLPWSWGMLVTLVLGAGHASVGSCSPHTEQRDRHSGAGEVVRARRAGSKRVTIPPEDNS
jgi:hypothetical protein